MWMKKILTPNGVSSSDALGLFITRGPWRKFICTYNETKHNLEEKREKVSASMTECHDNEERKRQGNPNENFCGQIDVIYNVYVV